MMSEHDVPIDWDSVVEKHREAIFAALDRGFIYYIANITGKETANKKKMKKLENKQVSVPTVDGRKIKVPRHVVAATVLSALHQDPRLRFSEFNGKKIIGHSISSMLKRPDPVTLVSGAFGTTSAASVDSDCDTTDDCSG